jgi:hypothetical protein
MRVKAFAIVAIGVLTVCAACRVEKFPTTRIPDDASLKLSFGCEKDSVKTGSECVINGQVKLATEDGAGAGWIVDLLVDKGTFIPASGDSIIHALRLTTGPVGEISARYRAPNEPSSVQVILTAQAAIKTDTLKVVNRDVGDDPPVSSIVLAPSPIMLKKGDSVLVTASFMDAAKNALPDRQGYFAIEHAAKATVAPGPAAKAWIKGLDTGTTTLRVTRRAIIGSAQITITM